jgi:hypothetical protein
VYIKKSRGTFCINKTAQITNNSLLWGGGVNMVTQAILPPPEPASFQEIWWVFKTRRRVLVTKSTGGKYRAVT